MLLITHREEIVVIADRASQLCGGKIVFTANRGLSGVGVSRKQWEEIEHAKAADLLPEWAHDQQGSFVPPFDSCDREADMAQAYEFFAAKLGITVARVS